MVLVRRFTGVRVRQGRHRITRSKDIEIMRRQKVTGSSVSFRFFSGFFKDSEGFEPPLAAIVPGFQKCFCVFSVMPIKVENG